MIFFAISTAQYPLLMHSVEGKATEKAGGLCAFSQYLIGRRYLFDTRCGDYDPSKCRKSFTNLQYLSGQV